MSICEIDLRSDTFTRPTTAMRQAMFEAEVGDDTVSEDPTVNRLEAICCQLLGKQAAMFCCTGTQSNQTAIWAHCKAGDEILIEQQGHIAGFEAGAPAALSGVSIRTIAGSRGMLDLEHLDGSLRPGRQHFSPTRLVCLENTTNIGGGKAYSLEQIRRVTGWAVENGLKTHLDGARLFNACIAKEYTSEEVARHFDTVSICFSKGLGCPMGSVLAGDEQTIFQARRARRMFGGGLRQSGIVAAAAIYALENNRNRLIDDHHNAKRLAEIIANAPELSVELKEVETNILFFSIESDKLTAEELEMRLRKKGVKLYAMSAKRLRAVTHLDVDRSMIETAGQIIVEEMNAIEK